MRNLILGICLVFAAASFPAFEAGAKGRCSTGEYNSCMACCAGSSGCQSACTDYLGKSSKQMTCYNNPECQRKRNAGDLKGAAAELAKPGGMSKADKNR